MARRMTSAALGVAATALALGALCAAPATAAAATAYDTVDQYLDQFPGYGHSPGCHHRNIYLAEGTYKWSQVLGGYTGPTRTIYLAKGTYYWEDCLEVPADLAYDQDSLLSLPGHPDALLQDDSGFHLTGSSGTYTWGSKLDPQF
ncbi:hypothetical protein [Streptomyces sp. HPF1205]|uniref:hypothetical protein n=1 Tax=Streptomyces sp. HPF1205 TaxID=2873262 RepID=UPI001CED962B|nr:hypothetical protein [Streptomyces sp. HPF1205]